MYYKIDCRQHRSFDLEPRSLAKATAKSGTLVARVCDEIRDAIISGRHAVGDKLPSESKLTEMFAVSRTVVREAVASLRADGLVEARQGAGVFVIANQMSGGPALLQIDARRVSSMIEILELRTAIELESAALAASRRSPAQEEAIYERLNEFGRAFESGRPTTEADFDFHLAIAEATNNPRFPEILEMFGHTVIPRTSLQSGATEDASTQYLQLIQNEHKTIADAISRGDAQAAREAMRTHLRGSQERYRRLLRDGQA